MVISSIEGEIVPQKNPASVVIQILLVVNLLGYVYDGFFGFTHRKIIFLGLSLVLLGFCLWNVREHFSWLDLIIGSVLAIGLLYYRFLSQDGYASLLFNIPFFVVAFCIAMICKYTVISRWTFLVYTALALLPFLYVFFILKKDMVGQSFFYSMNRNSISQLLIIATSLQVMTDSLQKRKYIFMFPSILTVVCSYFSLSRAGLLLSFCLFSIVLITNVKNWLLGSKKRIAWIKYHKGKAFILLCIVGLVAFIGIYFSLKGTRLASLGIKDSARASIFLEFFDQLSFRTFLIGFRPSLTGVTRLHNSFLTMLSYYGIFAFGLYILIAVSLLHYMKYSFTLFGVFGIWCLYSLVESISPLDIGDFVLIPLIMVALYQKGWELFPDKKKPIELVRSILKK